MGEEYRRRARLGSPVELSVRLATTELICYLCGMASNAHKTTTTTVRDSKSGRLVTVKGAGALKGKLTISKKVDLTKPIFAGAAKR